MELSCKQAHVSYRVPEHSAAEIICAAGGVKPLANGAAANKPVTRSHKSSDSVAEADSAAEPVSADSIMTKAAEPVSAVHEPTPVDMSIAGQTNAATDKSDQPHAGQQVPTNADNGPVGIAQEEAAPLSATAAADIGNKAALSAALAQAEVAGGEAAIAEARKAGPSAMAASAEAETAKGEATKRALEEAQQAQEAKAEGKLAPAKDAALSEHQQDQVWIHPSQYKSSSTPPLAPPPLAHTSASAGPVSTFLLLNTPRLCTRASQLAPCLLPHMPCPSHARLLCCTVPAHVCLPPASGRRACCCC